MDRAKLRKVAMLARDGEPGEREAANLILEKNGVTIDDLLGDIPEVVWLEFKYKTAFERTLIFQTYFKITNTDSTDAAKHQNRVELGIKPELAEHLFQSVKTVLELWRKELKRFQAAFIQRNGLFSSQPSKREPKRPMTEEELTEMFMMAASIKKANIEHHMLGDGGENG